MVNEPKLLAEIKRVYGWVGRHFWQRDSYIVESNGARSSSKPILTNSDGLIDQSFLEGTALAEYIADTVGAMVTGNTETGITVSYQDGDNTLDFDAQTAGDSRYVKQDASTTITGNQVVSGSVAVTQGTIGNEVLRLQSAATNDDPSEVVMQARGTTANGTIATLRSFTIPASTTYAIEAMLVARRTGGSAGTAEDGAFYKLIATFKNVGGTATQIGATTVVATHEDQAAWDVVFDVTGATARIRVTGALNNNVTWHMTARIWQVGT